jgi:hypothetical protein
MALLPEDLGSRVTYPVLETPKRGFRGPGYMLSLVTCRSYVGWQVVNVTDPP